MANRKWVRISRRDATLIHSAAESYLGDLESGLDDGTYEEGAGFLKHAEPALNRLEKAINAAKKRKGV